MGAGDDVLDGLLDHEVRLRAVQNAAVRRALRKVAALREAMHRLVTRGLADFPAGARPTAAERRRIERLLRELDRVAASTMSEVVAELRREAIAVGQYEAGYVRDLMSKAVKPEMVGLSLPVVEAGRLAAIIGEAPFGGQVFSEWAASVSAAAARNVRAVVRSGILRGEPVPEIARRAFGRAVRRGGVWMRVGGAFEVTTRHAETMVRSAYSAATNAARTATYQANEDILKGVEWVGTLDMSICQLCMARDGLLYTLDGKPQGHEVPWLEGPGNLHPRDRCTSTPVLKSWEELGLNATRLPKEYRRSMDGLVPAKRNFREWAQAGGYRRQVELFGRRRADAIRAGRLEVPDMWDDHGRFLTLRQLGLLESPG